MEAVSGSGGLVGALDEDCLEEVMARCSVQDLLSLGQTCKVFAELQVTSEKPWLARLAADFRLKVKALPGSTTPLSQLARNVYEAHSSAIRFQAILVNGGVDDGNLQYWADNMFLSPPAPPSERHRYYCSNCQRNADCLALLLDGEEVQRELQYEQVLKYMRQRCRYAAAVIANMDNLQLAFQQMVGDAEWMDLVEQWSEHRLEQNFRFLALQLENGHPAGRWLLYDVPLHQRAEEQQRISTLMVQLRDRLAHMRVGMLKEGNAWFDGSTIPQIVDLQRPTLVGILRDLTLCRAGSLTCPVSAGAVIAGVVDNSKLQGLCSAAEIASLLQAAVRDPACAALNSLETAASVEEAVAKGTLPRIANRNATVSGQWLEFEHPAESIQSEASTSNRPAPLISWTPLIWFKFHSKEEARQVALSVDDGQPGFVEATPAAVLDPADALDDASSESDEGSGPEDQLNHPGELPPGQAMVVDEDVEADALEGRDRTAGRNLLLVPLLRPCAANVLLVKLINQESYIDDDDPHDFPNIDCNYVSAAGKLVRLPSGIALVL